MSEKITFEQLQEKGSQIPKTSIDSTPNGPYLPEDAKVLKIPRFNENGIIHETSNVLEAVDPVLKAKKKTYRINYNDAVNNEKELKEAGVLQPFDGNRTGIDYDPSSKVVQQKMTELRGDLHQYQTQQTLENFTNISPFVIGAAGAAVIYNKFIKPKKK
jgi:hypothetical protein